MDSNGGEGLRGMIEAEYAFAAAAQHSIRGAFLDVLTEDSVVLAPRPTAGRAQYEAAKESTGLAWYPSVADVAGSDDLGFSSGPWTFGSGNGIVRGHFLSMWRHEADGRWRVAFDGGVSHAQAGIEPKLSSDVTWAPVPAPAGALVAQGAAELGIEEFQAIAMQAGLAAAIRTFGRDEGFLLLADDTLPLGWGAASRFLASRKPPAGWQQVAGGRSRDATLVYSVGEGRDGAAGFSYAQVWQFDPKVSNWGLRILLITRLGR